MSSITFCDLSKEWFNYNESDISITKSKIEYFLHIKGSTYAIRWSKPIAVSELKRLISHKWVCLYERQSRDFCGDCDGYDYSGCDMDRCREECEGCGGRKYKCNYRCFLFRNKTCINICYMSDTIKEDIQSAMDILAKVKEPHTAEADYWWNNYLSFWKSLNDDYDYLSSYLNLNSDVVNIYRRFKQEYDNAISLQKYRHLMSSSIEIKIIHKPDKYDVFKIPIENFTVEEKKSGILFWKRKYHYVSFKGYDCISDAFIEKHCYRLKNNIIYIGLKERVTNNTLKKIVLIEDLKMEDWDFCYE